MNKKTQYLTKAAVIAAAYVALTYLSAAFGLAYGGVQFRVSEALTVLPIFCPAAIPGLTLGCLLSNVTSTVNPIDMLLGTLATLLACLVTWAARNLRVKRYPLLSFLAPVIANGLIIGAEIAFFTTDDTFWHAYLINGLSVAAGEAAVVGFRLRAEVKIENTDDIAGGTITRGDAVV